MHHLVSARCICLGKLTSRLSLRHLETLLSTEASLLAKRLRLKELSLVIFIHMNMIRLELQLG